MNYLDFLRKELPAEWELTNETNINWDGVKTVGILKSQSGTNFQDSEVLPVQLVILSNDIMEVQKVLDKFITKNHNTYYVDGINTYVKQYYYTPVIPVTATPTGNTLTHEIILGGTLLVSVDVSDIKEMYIDGERIRMTTASFGMATDAESNVKIFGAKDPQLSQITIKKANYNLQFSLVNKNSTFCNALRNFRMGLKDINTIFNVELRFTDDVIERYKMKVTSYGLTPADGQLPVLQVTMSVWEVGF